MDEDEREIYRQDCESFRYEDKTFWSRFQTLIVIEGAAIGVIFTETISGLPQIILAFGTLLICLLISLLALKDREDSINFIHRISEYEQKKGVTKIIPKEKVKLLCISVPFNSLIFTNYLSLTLIALNIYLIVYSF